MGSKENIIVIMCDQLKVDTLGCYGNTICQTPAIDSLAKDGVTFDTAYTTCPICSPSRASLQNGLYPSRHGLTSNTLDQASRVHEIKDTPRVLSHQLAPQGYSMGFTGKWHLGFGYRPNATAEEISLFPNRYITEERAIPSMMGFEADDFPGYGGLQSTGGERYREYLKENNLEYKNTITYSQKNEHTCWGEVTSPVESTMDYFLIERSKKYISDFKERGKPFCFQTHFWGPHASAMPPKEVMDKYRDVEIPPSPSWEDSLVDKPRIHNLWRRHEKDWPYFQEFIRHYWAYMESIDTQIGRLLDFLKEENLYDNSWIIFTADHGDSQGCHRGLENKSIHMYEETTRIPLIVKAPAKYESGGRRNQPVGTCDIYATMLDIAGIDLTNDDGDGMSLVPLMKDQNAPWRDATVTECFGLSGISFSQKMIRSGSLKYVFNSGDIDELYDLDKDPYELHNCINDANRQEDLKAMRDKLCAWMEEHDDGDQGLWAFKQLTA